LCIIVIEIILLSFISYFLTSFILTEFQYDSVHVHFFPLKNNLELGSPKLNVLGEIGINPFLLFVLYTLI